MDQTFERQFQEYSATRLQELTGRIETCLGMLDEERIWARGSKNENAIGNLVLHLCGNVRQWIVSGVGGPADVRTRDAEFAAQGGKSPRDLGAALRGTVTEAVQVIQAATAERLGQRTSIQGYDVSGLEAIYHVVEHFSGHTGQIIFATKMLTSRDLGFHHHLRATDPHEERTP